MDNTIEHRFCELLVRVLLGKATEREHEEIKDIITLHPELRLLHDLIVQDVGDMTTEGEMTEAMQAYTAHYVKMRLAGYFDTHPNSTSLKDRANTGQPVRSGRLAYKPGITRTRRWAMAGVATILVLLCGVVFSGLEVAWFDKGNEPQSSGNEVITKKGSQSHVKLPDGTEVWLNGDSRLVYADDFNKTTREVQLVGEGFFNVAKNVDKPFVIHSQSMHVKVLGTSFNVRAYPNEQHLETTLITGEVEVTLDSHPNQKIHIQQGEKLIVRNELLLEKPGSHVDGVGPIQEEAPIIQLTKVKPNVANGGITEQLWTENILVFDGESFGKVVSKVERWYNITVVVENTALYASNFTASFENKTVDQVFNALEYVGKFRYELSNDTVYVY